MRATGFNRRDVGLQRQVFSLHADVRDSTGSTGISPEKLPGALAAVFARVPLDDKRIPALAFDSATDFAEFQRMSVAPSPLERWLARLPLAQIIGDSMPPDVSAIELNGSGMRALAGCFLEVQWFLAPQA